MFILLCNFVSSHLYFLLPLQLFFHFKTNPRSSGLSGFSRCRIERRSTCGNRTADLGCQVTFMPQNMTISLWIHSSQMQHRIRLIKVSPKECCPICTRTSRVGITLTASSRSSQARKASYLKFVKMTCGWTTKNLASSS